MAIAGPCMAGQETITVTTLNDVVDFSSPQQVANLPGPDGKISFREAVLAVNNTAGPQTIAFAIPQSEWWLLLDRALLRLENGTFVITGDQTTVDFTTQTDFTGDTNPNGWEVGVYGLQPNAWGVTAIRVSANDCVIKGLDRVMQRGYGVDIDGNNNRVISCTISGPLYAGVKVQGNVGDPAVGNIIGGTGPGEGNVLSGGNAGIRVDGPTDGTIVIGNVLLDSPFAGVQVRGAYCCPGYTPFNTRIGGPTPQERNWIADNGKFGEEGFPLGDQVDIEYAVDTIVEGNYIGTTQDGGAPYPGAHGTAGVAVRESEGTIIRHNLISGIRKMGVNHYAGDLFGNGIYVFGPDEGTTITGNLIGTDAAGENPVPNLNGITFAWFQGYPPAGQVGGNDAGDANTIAFNERTGITIASGATGIAIHRNSIHSNGLLGVDLLPSSGSAGVTANDPGDGDSGGNMLQNFPVLAAAASDGSSTHVQGTLNSTPNSQFTLEFFASAECDPSGHGEGESFLGAIAVSTDASGNAAFDATLPTPAPPDSVATATATNATGNTSEFSACQVVAAVAEPRAADINGDGVVDVSDLLMVINAWGGCENPPAECPADIAPPSGDSMVDVNDLLAVISDWG